MIKIYNSPQSIDHLSHIYAPQGPNSMLSKGTLKVNFDHDLELCDTYPETGSDVSVKNNPYQLLKRQLQCRKYV